MVVGGKGGRILWHGPPGLSASCDTGGTFASGDQSNQCKMYVILWLHIYSRSGR
jgi:hypothetical protein